MADKTRVLVLGGGFGGLYAALEFEKRNDPRFEVTVEVEGCNGLWALGDCALVPDPATSGYCPPIGRKNLGRNSESPTRLH
jgi:NADH dehydrogenase FAD-containing subunit